MRQTESAEQMQPDVGVVVLAGGGGGRIGGHGGTPCGTRRLRVSAGPRRGRRDATVDSLRRRTRGAVPGLTAAKIINSSYSESTMLLAM
ncbi:hypothetical protein Van01_26110 [Micromonospora andamanensis]|uniref:Nucleotidyl transferase domain-containing protein n=1 Tax=Micromonospora andamanensis TaxID=1287068 RepID=A0ABQ4HUU0_9ACTN|nr:hypothetical protein Van01_26110 [Micromonospora andamanensis]